MQEIRQGVFWADPRHYYYKTGDLYVGYHDHIYRGVNEYQEIIDTHISAHIGVSTERHAITVAGAGAGKGTCVIIPNLKRWIHNTLVIDPKGEAAAATYQDRLNLGQSVVVVDPFKSADVNDYFRSGFNPLDILDPESSTIGIECKTIADGIVKRHDPRHAMWDDAAVTIIAGLIAFVKVAEPPEKQTLSRMREILRSDEVYKAFELMAGSHECAGLLQTAASVMEDESGNAFLSNARRNSEWLDIPDISNSLSNSTFSLSALKSDKISVFLVLPADMLSECGGFLRLFVRCAIRVMQRKSGTGLRDQQCLFILDEFYSLGKIDEIQKSAGLMRGYGLQLWPILQDIGQLIELYGREGADTFFANSDLAQFMGNTDQTTLEFMCRMAGSKLGLKPDQMAAAVQKHHDIVASGMFCVLKGADHMILHPMPYFRDSPEIQSEASPVHIGGSPFSTRPKNIFSTPPNAKDYGDDLTNWFMARSTPVKIVVGVLTIIFLIHAFEWFWIRLSRYL